MQLPSLTIIPQRHAKDCAVACLAMLCGVDYEQALMAFPHNVYMSGASGYQIKAAARRLGHTLLLARRLDLENQTGLLALASVKWEPSNHLVLLKDGQIIDPDRPCATLWDVDVYLAAYDARPLSVLYLKDNTNGPIPHTA